MTNAVSSARDHYVGQTYQDIALADGDDLPPVLRDRKTAIGVISIAGPRVRLNEAKMLQLGPALLDAAAELGASSAASTHFKQRPLHGRA